MPKKVKIKTTESNASVSAYLNTIEPPSARKDAKQLAALFKKTTGAKPRMWGSSIVGYGKYKYYRANGDEGQFMATGFSIRKSGPVVYIMPGYTQFVALMPKLGPHKLGKSCLYLKNLEGIDLEVLKKLVTMGIEDLKKRHDVNI